MRIMAGLSRVRNGFRRLDRSVAAALAVLLWTVAAAPTPGPHLIVRPLEASTPAPDASASADPDADPADASPQPMPAMTFAPISPTALGTMKAIGPEDAANLAFAKQWFTHVQSGDVDRTRLTPAIDAVLTPAMIAQAAKHFGPFGPPTVFYPGGKYQRAGVSTYLIRVGWPAGAIFFQFAIDDASGKVAGYFTRPFVAPKKR